MNSIQLTFSMVIFFSSLNSNSRGERAPRSNVVIQGDRSSVQEARAEKWQMTPLSQSYGAVADHCWNKRRASFILSSCGDTESWSQLLFSNKEKNAFLNQGNPGLPVQSRHSLATVIGLWTNTSVLLSWAPNLLGPAAVFMRLFWMQISYGHLTTMA